MRTLALIPARGGSKGVPRKNVKPLGGRPLIAHSIGAARTAARVDRLLVTTDDDEIAEVAAREGAEVVRRPHELADDAAPMLGVVEHAIQAIEGAGDTVDVVTLLQPTCPFRRPEDVDASLALLAAEDVDGVFGMLKLSHVHPARMYRLRGARLEPFVTAEAGLNRQDLEDVYQRNGAIYSVRVAAMRREGTLLVSKAAPMVMDEIRSINIDDPFDWTVAEAFAAALPGARA